MLVHIVFGLPDDTTVRTAVVFGGTAAGVGVAALIAFRVASSVGSTTAPSGPSALRPPVSAWPTFRRPATRFYPRRGYYNRSRRDRLPRY